MKRTVTLVLVLLIAIGITGCKQQYHKDSFFNDTVLNDHLVPDLPKPNAEKMLAVDAYGLNDYCVYIRSNQSAESYFQILLEYLEPLGFRYYGTVHSVKNDHGVILGMEHTYYYDPTNDLSSILARNYYFEEEYSYIFVYSNGEWQENEDGERFLSDVHLLRVCCNSGTYKSDDLSFDYDYYIEFAGNPSVWLG